MLSDEDIPYIADGIERGMFPDPIADGGCFRTNCQVLSDEDIPYIADGIERGMFPDQITTVR